LSAYSYSLIDWDEGVFALQGQWFSQLGASGKPFNFQTPPLYQILVGILFKIFGAHGVILRYISLFFSAVTIYIVFRLARLFTDARVALFSVILFVSCEFFLFFSRSGLSEATFVFFLVCSVFLFFKALETNKGILYLMSGIVSACACYTKYSAFPLLIAFFIIGIYNRRKIHKAWFVSSVLLPAVLFLPYVFAYLSLIGMAEFSARHASLLSLNHHKFLVYMFLFAPVPTVLMITALCIRSVREKPYVKYTVIIMAVYFLLLGFYYPYFRLAYPLVPLCALIAVHALMRLKNKTIYVMVGAALISLLFAVPTLVYSTHTPEHIGQVARDHIRTMSMKYLITHVPPNIDFYMPGTIAVPADHPWHRLMTRIPAIFARRKIIQSSVNELVQEDHVLYICATHVVDTSSAPFLQYGDVLERIEFKDAPVYYKDLFNPTRNKPQVYEFYLFDLKKEKHIVDFLWDLGFEKGVTVRVIQ
jgi:uncharacterized membrane protein